MPLRIYPVIAVLLMLLFAGNHEARAQDTCSTAVAIEHDSTHSITILPGIDRVWLTFATDSTAGYLSFEPGLDFTGFDTIIVYTGNCGQLNHHLSVGSTDSVVTIRFSDTIQQYFIEILRSSASGMATFLIRNNPRTPWPFASTPPSGCNLLSNSDFETLNPAANGYPGTTGEHSLQFNFLTDWQYAWGTPNISPKEPWDPSKDHSVFLFHQSPNKGEAIFQDIVGLIPGNRYELSIDVKHGNHPGHPRLMVDFTNLFTPSQHTTLLGGAGTLPTNYLTYHNLANDPLVGLSLTQFNNYVFPFTFQSGWYADLANVTSRITIHNLSNTPSSIIAAMVVDNVVIAPSEELQLSIVNCINVSASLTGSYSAVQYDWYADQAMTILLLSNSATFNIQNSGLSIPCTVWAKATYHNGQCTAENSISISHPSISATGGFVMLCPPSKSSGQLAINTSGGTPPFNYSWSPVSGLTNPNVASPGVSLFTPGNHSYTVTITDAYGCVATAQSIVTVLDDEPLEISGTRSICEDIPIQKTYSLTNYDPNYTYTWLFNPAYGSIVSQSGGSVIVQINALPLLPNGATLEVFATSPETICDKYGAYNIYECCILQEVHINLIDEELTLAKITSSDPLLLQGTIEIKQNLTIGNNMLWMGPEAKIVVAPGVVFKVDLNSAQTYKAVMQGCDVMWDGIYVEDLTAQLEIEDTYVLDALQAVVSKNGGAYLVKNCQFMDNFIGIHVQKYYAVAPTMPQTNHPGVVVGTLFTSTTPSGMLQYHPRQGLKPFCGIRTRMVNDLTIGDNGLDKNVFEKMEYGVLATNSNLTLYHNEFDNNRPEPLSVFNGLTGAVSAEFNYGDLSAYQIRPEINIVGQSNQVRNFFQNGYKGVQGRNIKMVVTDNYFQNHTHYGINGVDIKDETQITGNEVLGAFTGIKLTNAAKSRINVTVDNNVVKNVNRGIHTINLGGDRYGGKRLLITYNEIRPDRITREKRGIGIYVESSPHSHVFCNSIYLPPPIIHQNSRDSVIGIWMSQTENAAIANNNVLLFGYGIFTTGVQFNNRFFCNTLDNCYHGFFFGPDTRLTDQGWANIPNKTDWVPHNAFFNDIVGYQRMETDYGNILTSSKWYYMDNQGSNYDIDIYPNSKCSHYYMGIQPIEGILNNNATHSCLYTSVNNCIPDLETMSNDSTLSPEERDWLYQAYLEMDELLQQVNPEYYCYSAEYLFLTLFQDSSLMYLGGGLDGEFQEFYDSLRNEPLSRFIKVEQMIRNGQYQEALAENLAIEPKNTLETYRQEVYRLYLTQFCMNLFTLAPEDSAYLLNIATLTPYHGGYGVYTARVMLGIDPEDHGVAYRKPEPAVSANIDQVRVYPNPTSQLLTIELSDDGKPVNGFVEFYNIYGQLIHRSPISHHSTNLAVNAFPPGVLFYRVVNRGFMVGSGKVVITK